MLSLAILVFSVALLLFYLQATCERILARSFEDPIPDPIIEANRLIFPAARKALVESDAPIDGILVRTRLMSDYDTLVYLLRNAATERRKLAGNEQLLAGYFRALSIALPVLRWTGISERAALLKMTAVLGYFADALGERIKQVRFERLAASSI